MRLRALILVSGLAVGVPSALAWAGRPAVPPPKAPNPGAPPPAWIETKTNSAWLAYGSYCWKTTCVNMIPPNSRPDLPMFVTRRGSLLRVHLGFAAKSVTVSLGNKPVPTTLDATKRIASWRGTRGGILMVTARAAGDASYVGRLRVT
jgi:hypothetical protein